MVYDSKRRGKGRVDGHGVMTVSKDVSCRLTVAFSYRPQLVANIRVIEDHKWRLSLLSLRGRVDRSNLFDSPRGVVYPHCIYPAILGVYRQCRCEGDKLSSALPRQLIGYENIK